MSSVKPTTGKSASKSAKKPKKLVNVVLLTGEEYSVFVDTKAKFQEIYNQIALYHSLRETEYFGLAQLIDGEYQFVNLTDKITKHAPKAWKASTGEGLDGAGKPLITLYFRVQFYVDQVILLRENITRHLYYLQLKENIVAYHLLSNEEKGFQLAALALQADHGNYTPSRHASGYFDPRQYFPAWVVEKRGWNYLCQNGPVLHQDLRHVTKSEAQLKFIKESSTSPAAHNLHFYRLRKRKVDKTWNAWLGVSVKGIEIYEDSVDGFKDVISLFLWADIGRLHFEKKRFEIRCNGVSKGRKFTYYTENDRKSKYLLSLCRTTHMFQMDIQPKLREIHHMEAKDKGHYRESYIYSDTKDLVINGVPVQPRGLLSPKKCGSTGQRYSIVSNTSSNTTSGIVSDKLYCSFDENEEEPEHEIMINTPPTPGICERSPRAFRIKSPVAIRTRQLLLPFATKDGKPLHKQRLKSDPGKLTAIRVNSNHSRTSTMSLPVELAPFSSATLKSNGSYRTRLQQQEIAYGVQLQKLANQRQQHPPLLPSPRQQHPPLLPSPRQQHPPLLPSPSAATPGKNLVSGIPQLKDPSTNSDKPATTPTKLDVSSNVPLYQPVESVPCQLVSSTTTQDIQTASSSSAQVSVPPTSAPVVHVPDTILPASHTIQSISNTAFVTSQVVSSVPVVSMSHAVQPLLQTIGHPLAPEVEQQYFMQQQQPYQQHLQFTTHPQFVSQPSTQPPQYGSPATTHPQFVPQPTTQPPQYGSPPTTHPQFVSQPSTQPPQYVSSAVTSDTPYHSSDAPYHTTSSDLPMQYLAISHPLHDCHKHQGALPLYSGQNNAVYQHINDGFHDQLFEAINPSYNGEMLDLDLPPRVPSTHEDDSFKLAMQHLQSDLSGFDPGLGYAHPGFHDPGHNVLLAPPYTYPDMTHGGVHTRQDEGVYVNIQELNATNASDLTMFDATNASDLTMFDLSADQISGSYTLNYDPSAADYTLTDQAVADYTLTDTDFAIHEAQEISLLTNNTFPEPGTVEIYESPVAAAQTHTLNDYETARIAEPVQAYTSVQEVDGAQAINESSLPGQSCVTDDPTPGASGDAKPKPRLKTNRKKEPLHPELEEIRGKSRQFSLPLITALFNDRSLLQFSNSNSSDNTSDTATRSTDSQTRSIDSRIGSETRSIDSRIGSDTDPRRLSSCYPSSSGTMLTLQGTAVRPFSWHSENFDLDAHIAQVHGLNSPVLDNRRSMPQCLCEVSSVSPPGSWTQVVTSGNLSHKASGLERCSHEHMVSQHMIPTKITTGGHTGADGGMRGLKENVGIA